MKTMRLLRLKPLFATMLALPLLAQAQVALPSAGSLLQQIQPVPQAAPLPAAPELRIEADGKTGLPESAPFLVTRFEISGNQRFDSATLHALIADGEGKSMTLSELNTLVARITEYYHSHGYPLARAIIAAQVIRDGVIQISVIEARYGQIKLDNSSRVQDSLLNATLATLQAGQEIEQNQLDHALLLLADIPGLSSSATLAPGQAVGSSDLLVKASATPALTGNAVLDNDGNRYTGRARLGATLNYLNPLQYGDVLSANGLSSGSGMNYLRLSYETLLSGQGSRLGASVSALHYVLGDPLAALNAHGTAQVTSVWAKHPFLRTRALNLSGQLQFDRLQLRDHIDASALQTDRHLENWSASLAGDIRDSVLLGAVSNANVSWSSGRVGFDNDAAQVASAATANTQGRFSKWNVNLARLQSVSPGNAVYLSAAAQWANGNLDSSQKMTLGGVYSVRAYDTGALSGDTGYSGSAEVRHDLGALWRGQGQAVAFVDSAHVTVNQHIWVAGANSATLSGAGVGLNWAGAQQWNAKLSVAKRFGATPALVASSSSVRAWIEFSKGF